MIELLNIQVAAVNETKAPAYKFQFIVPLTDLMQSNEDELGKLLVAAMHKSLFEKENVSE